MIKHNINIKRVKIRHYLRKERLHNKIEKTHFRVYTNSLYAWIVPLKRFLLFPKPWIKKVIGDVGATVWASFIYHPTSAYPKPHFRVNPEPWQITKLSYYGEQIMWQLKSLT